MIALGFAVGVIGHGGSFAPELRRRVLVFYVLSIFLIVSILPWNDAKLAESPFVAALDLIGVPGAADVIGSMAFVSDVRDQLWWSLGSLAFVLLAARLRTRRPRRRPAAAGRATPA